ncbi:thiazole tautomerase TenI [Bacillus sp. B-TM1]
MKNELHVISNGHMSFEELVNVAMQIESEIDYLHIREREKSTKELYEGVESLLKKGFPASKIVINDRIDIAILLNIPRVQLGYRSADVRSVKEKFSYLHVGYSVHSLEEAIDAFKNGADSLVYGHVFPTDCKKGVPARGLEEIPDITAIPLTPLVRTSPVFSVVIPPIAVIGMDKHFAMSGIISSSNPYSKAKSYKESIRKWAEKHV